MQQGRCQYNEHTLSTHWRLEWRASGSRIFDPLKRASQAASGRGKQQKRKTTSPRKGKVADVSVHVHIELYKLIVCVRKTKEIGLQSMHRAL